MFKEGGKVPVALERLKIKFTNSNVKLLLFYERYFIFFFIQQKLGMKLMINFQPPYLLMYNLNI